MLKQVFFYLAILLVAISGCKKETIKVQSVNYDANSTTWTTSDSGYTWVTNLSVPEITTTVLNSGSVQVFVVYNAGGTTYNDPTPIFYPGSGINISSSISVGNVDVYYESTTNYPLTNPDNYTFRVVVTGPGKKEYQPAANEHLIPSTIKH